MLHNNLSLNFLRGPRAVNCMQCFPEKHIWHYDPDLFVMFLYTPVLCEWDTYYSCTPLPMLAAVQGREDWIQLPVQPFCSFSRAIIVIWWSNLREYRKCIWLLGKLQVVYLIKTGCAVYYPKLWLILTINTVINDWMELLTGTFNKLLLAGSVPVNELLLAGTVLMRT